MSGGEGPALWERLRFTGGQRERVADVKLQSNWA
jgi:hypothetical protein